MKISESYKGSGDLETQIQGMKEGQKAPGQALLLPQGRGKFESSREVEELSKDFGKTEAGRIISGLWSTLRLFLDVRGNWKQTSSQRQKPSFRFIQSQNGNKTR